MRTPYTTQVALAVAAALLVSGVARADARVVGHMPPFPEEMLDPPVTLTCGATVREARSFTPDYRRLNRLCTRATTHFFPFIERKGLEVTHREPFAWGISFLPERTCYRCLNDEAYRFRYRQAKGAVIGYTDKNSEYFFMTTIVDREFSVTFVHELFHALSMFYGIYDAHPGSWESKAAADEKLAVEFTEWLGYGR